MITKPEQEVPKEKLPPESTNEQMDRLLMEVSRLTRENTRLTEENAELRQRLVEVKSKARTYKQKCRQLKEMVTTTKAILESEPTGQQEVQHRPEPAPETDWEDDKKEVAEEEDDFEARKSQFMDSRRPRSVWLPVHIRA